jgi:hypothetical protein
MPDAKWVAPKGKPRIQTGKPCQSMGIALQCVNFGHLAVISLWMCFYYINKYLIDKQARRFKYGYYTNIVFFC